MESVRIQSFSGPYFPAFGLSMEIYRVNVRIQSKLGENTDQKNSEYGHFLRSIGFQIPLDCLQVSLLTLNEFSKLINFYFL